MGSTLTAHTFSSGILAIGSRAAMVRRLAAASLKWKVMNTTPWSGRSIIAGADAKGDLLTGEAWGSG